MFKDLFNETKRKKYQLYAYTSFISFIILLMLSIFSWSKMGVYTLPAAIFVFLYWLYSVSWLNNSNRFYDLKVYYDSDHNDEIIRTLFYARMHLRDKEVYKEIGIVRPFIYAYVDGDGGHYWFSFKERGMVFTVRFNEYDIVYSYEKHTPHETDNRDKIANETVYYPINRTELEGLDFKTIIMKLLEIYKGLQ